MPLQDLPIPMANLLIATLVSRPDAKVLSDGLMCDLAQALPVTKIAWLDAGQAADIALASPMTAAAAARLIRARLAGAPVDVIVQPAQGRRKRLLVADMDSTMIGQECIDELADFAGLKPQVAAITAQAMRGEIAFEPALRARVALLKGLSKSLVDQVIAERITLTPGARTLIATMRAHGASTLLVSGGFTLFTEILGPRLGFDRHYGNVLRLEGEHFSGTVEEPILGRRAKFDILCAEREKLGLAAPETLAIGDGANDLDMLQEAGLGVAFHAKPAVAEAADTRLDHADLTALLYAQGYARSQWVGG
jgi:phosphoserine phosphatase